MNRKIRAWLAPAIMFLVIASLVACQKNEQVPPATPQGQTQQPAKEDKGWEPEKTQPIEVSDADYWNKQGVVKAIHFDTDKAEIRPGDRQILKANAAWLLEHPEFRVSVQGHCDERNTEDYNLALGERRANAAKEYLLGLGVSADKIQTVSFGKAKPVDTDHTEEAWAKNRRDEFILIDAKK